MRDWTFIALLIAAAVRFETWWVTLPCIVAIGVVQFAIGEALLHEASHYNLVRRDRRWNDALGAICALPFLTTLRDWRAEHVQHHARFGFRDDHIAVDYARHELTGPSPRIGWVWLGKPFLGLTAIRHVRDLVDTNSSRGWLQIAAFWIPVVAVCWMSQHMYELLMFWLVPELTVFATLLHWSEIADHYRTRSGSRSRTGRFHNWMFHNNGYHAIHHRYPVVPFHHLPAAHRAFDVETADVTGGWWGVWRQISRPPEVAPESWAAFWPADDPANDKSAGS